MGTFIITLAILSLAAYIFTHIWKFMLQFFYYFFIGIVGLANYLIVAVRRFGKVCYITWYKVRDKYFRKEAPHTEEYEVDEDDVPEGLKDELDNNEEVIVKKNHIETNEF